MSQLELMIDGVTLHKEILERANKFKKDCESVNEKFVVVRNETLGTVLGMKFEVRFTYNWDKVESIPGEYGDRGSGEYF